MNVLEFPESGHSKFLSSAASCATSIPAFSSHAKLWLKPTMDPDLQLNMDYGTETLVPSEAVLHWRMRQVVFVAKGNGYYEPRNHSDIARNYKETGVLFRIRKQAWQTASDESGKMFRNPAPPSSAITGATSVPAGQYRAVHLSPAVRQSTPSDCSSSMAGNGRWSHPESALIGPPAPADNYLWASCCTIASAFFT